MEQYLQYLSLVLLSALCSGQVLTNDACLPQGHKELKQDYRSSGWDVRTSDTPQCDDKLRRGWYKFVDFRGQSVEMPTTCPGTDKCGTTIPVWMDGEHPTVEDSIVTRRLCGMVERGKPNADCCEYEDHVFVQNCNGFYIYYLNPTMDCSAVYCAGTAERCPVGKWSSTNFTPCRDPAPVLTTPPSVKGPNVHADKTLDFRCEIEYGPVDADQVFEVVWTFNGVADPSIKTEILTGDQRVVTLSGDIAKRYLDTEVGCQVTTNYVGREKDKNTYRSTSNFFGVQAVKLTGPNLRGTQSFDFECEVTFGSNDPNQQIELVWTLNGKSDPEVKSQIISGQDRKATLDGRALKDHLNSHIGCQARLVYEKYNIVSKFVQSNIYFAGIQIAPVTGRLQISSSEAEKQFTVTSTIPVICDQGPVCCLNFKMQIDKASVVTIKDACEHTICSSDWDPAKKQASFIVTVVPSRNSISAGTSTAVLSFNEIVVSGSGPYVGVFTSYKPNPLLVTVKLEGGFKCSITGDPHFLGHDFKGIYDLYKTGDYTVYEVKSRDFQVQIRTWPCWAVTCVCGVVVKEKNDIIRVHGCDKPGRLTASSVDVPYQLSPGTVVLRSANGAHIGVLLPSGSEIKIDMGSLHMNVYINTPAYDKGQAVGICGTNDGIPDNDFTHPDGTVTPLCTGRGRCIPVTFTESWRVTGDTSMFEVTPQQVQPDPPTEFCSCTANSKGKSQLICSPRQHIQDPGLACKNCPAITNSLKPTPWGQPEQQQKRYVHQTVKPVDQNKQWPNDQGLTEAQARDLCNQAIQKSQLYPLCQNVANLVSSAMEECLGDILNGGTTEALDAVTTSFTSNCQLTLAKDQNNYIIGPDGTLVLKPAINDLVCPFECSVHGRCAADGSCKCVRGWEGETCQIESGKGPQIRGTTGSPFCSGGAQKSCDRIAFDKSNVNIHDKLRCRVQPVNDQGKKIGQPVILDPLNESAERVTCPLPSPALSFQRYIVSVTVDGVTYGNTLPVYIFDSACLECDVAGCRTKTNTCFINNVCYKHGQSNTNNRRQVCDANRNRMTWSALPVV